MMQLEADGDSSLSKFRLGLKGKLIIIFVLVMAIPLLVLSWLAQKGAQLMGDKVATQTALMTEQMRESVARVGAKTTSDAFQALELVSRERIERLSTDVAREIAKFLYDRDEDIRLASRLPLSESSFRNFIESRTRQIFQHGPWGLSADQKSWVPLEEPREIFPEITARLEENKPAFHYRPPDSDGKKVRIPLYLEMTFVDLDGREQIKVTTSDIVSAELRDVSRKENTFCKAETYFRELSSLKKDEIYVSRVVGQYVGSRIQGPYTPERARLLGIPFEPEKAGYAGKENPVGKRFRGLIRWATPVIRDDEIVGYVTLALDHTHIMEFTDHLVPTEERYSSISDASSGNYGYLADYQGRVIAHPRQYYIVGYDSDTGKLVPTWLDQETYSMWQASGKDFEEFIKDYPEYNAPSRHKSPALEQLRSGQLGLDYKYLNFAPQCLEFQSISEYGGSGSFHLYWSGLWKLSASAAVPYYTGQYGSTKRGFGHVGITANIDEFHRPALETKNYIDNYLAERDETLSRQHDTLKKTVSDTMSSTIGRLGLSTGVMVIIIVCMATWMASALSNRVAAIIKGIRQFQAGNLGHRLAVKSRDEIGQLAAAFNQMADSIQTSYQQLKESEQKFRAIFNQTFQLTGFLSPDGTVLAANTAMQEFLRSTESELVGKACWTLPWGNHSRDLQEQIQDAVMKASTGEFLRFEATNKTEEKIVSSFDFSLKPFRDESGSLANLVLEARDITELKQAEQELRKHRDQLEHFVQERTRELIMANEQLQKEILERKQAEQKVREERDKAQRYLDIAGTIIILIDSDQKIALVNRQGCEVLGYKESELIGKNWFTTLLPEDEREKDQMLFFTQMAKKSGAFEYMENTVITREGQRLTIAWQNSVLTDKNGKAIGILRSGVDITQRKKTEEELRRARDAAEVANRTKSAFLANISHEIRTPMNAILGFCQLMQADESLTPKQRENLEAISRSGEHLLGLINEVLEMSKIEAGRITLNKTTFDFYSLLEDLEMMFRVRTDSRGLQFVVTRSPELPRYVIGDQGKLRQILINLLGNAVKFTEKGGIFLNVYQYDLSAYSREHHMGHNSREPISLILEVKDTGVGIRPEHMEKIFHAFEQAGDGNTPDGGTGLGLAITREFVQIMGGEISVTSKPGHGSTFKVKIPMEFVTETQPIACMPRKRVISAQPGYPEVRVLVVDDIQTNRDILCEMLTRVGHHVRTANNGKEAISLFHQWQPHVILMDMKMPVMDGREAANRIKSLPGGDKCVIIAVTAGALEEQRETVLAQGLDDFIRKPFREEEIFGSLKRHLGIQYIYKEEGDKQTFLNEKPKPCEQALATLSSLPAQLIRKMKEALTNLEIDRLKELLIDVEQLNHQAAEIIGNFIEAYDFETLEQFLWAGKDAQ